MLDEEIRLPFRATPAVSPAEQWIAYTLEDPESSDCIFLVRPDGSETIRVPTGSTAVGEPTLFTEAGRTRVAFTALPESGAEFRSLHVMELSGLSDF